VRGVTTTRVEIRLLGPLEVRRGDAVISLPRRQQRALLAALGLRAGEVVSTDRLVLDLWGESAPASATGSLQNTVSALRKLIGRDVLVTRAPGYRLALPREAVDSHRFERLLKEAREAEPSARARLLGEGLELWRGPALADLDEEEFARREAARLDELRLEAQEERIDAELQLGRHPAVIAELEQLVAAQPLRERSRAQLMLALYRCGRQAEALEVYRAARLALADELGLDPSPELQELERKILRQDREIGPPTEVVEDETRRDAPELRLVTVLAATPPAAEDPEQHRRLLDETLARVRETLERHGGSLERFGPEGLVAVFGADGPADDDAIRAVMAARELGLAAGVATGEVVQGTGAVVTRAAELARVGGIRLDERTAALARAKRRFDAPLVGREEELEQLRAALAAVRTVGRCRVVTVVGDPGIGKTRLARELATRAGAETTVLVARCIAHGDGATFLPLLSALRRTDPKNALAGEADAELVLGRLSALAEGGQAAPLGESYWAVRRLLEALARAQPVLLVLDDVHWAEPALVDLVEYLADRAAARMFVLCLARPQLERPLGDRLELGPLDEDETRAVVAGTAELAEETSARIAELAEGNALYAEQLATFAAEGGEGLPPTLEAVLAGRLGRLDPGDRAVLQRAAVIGREFSLGAVGALVGGEVARELLSLARAGFVHAAPSADPSDDGYTFHHVLLRDAAYTTLTKADRAELHERAAAWIDRDGPGDDAIAGYHLEQAVLYRRDLGESADEVALAAGKRLGTAGMRALRTNDVAATVGLLGRAIVLLPPSEHRAELQLERSVALQLQDRPEEAEESMRSAEHYADAAGSKRLRARAECDRVHPRLMSGELKLDQAVAILAAAMPVLERAGDSRGLARAEITLSNVHWFAGRHDELAAAAARAERHYVDSGSSIGTAIGVQAEALYWGAVPVPRALELCAELLERIPDQRAQATTTTVIGALRALEGDAADARSLLAHARSLYEETGNTTGLLTTWTHYYIEAESIIGDPAAALTAGRSSIERLLAKGDVAHAVSQAVVLAHLLLDDGDADAADRFVRVAEERALSSDVLSQFTLRAARARLLGRKGKTIAAEEMARDAVSLASFTDALRERARAHIALAEVLQLAGSTGAARAEVTTARKLLRQKGASALLKRHPAPAPALR
jgi:DNA-binding SARP family transcriptional activator